jgi:hypothetical protein
MFSESAEKKYLTKRSCLSAGLGRLRCDDPSLSRHSLPPLVVQQEQVRGHRPQEGLEVALCAHAQPYGLEIYPAAIMQLCGQEIAAFALTQHCERKVSSFGHAQLCALEVASLAHAQLFD